MSVKYDDGKRRPLLLPVVFVRAVQDVLEFGAKKYSVNGWQTVPDAKDRYVNALVRHVEEVMLGVQTGKGPFVRDEESGLMHLAHVGCNVAFLIWLGTQEKE